MCFCVFVRVFVPVFVVVCSFALIVCVVSVAGNVSVAYDLLYECMCIVFHGASNLDSSPARQAPGATVLGLPVVRAFPRRAVQAMAGVPQRVP